MSQRTVVLFGILAAILLGVACVAGWQLGRGTRARAMSRSAIGGSTRSDGFGISSGHLYIDAPKPGSFFGTITRPGAAEQFTYFVIVKYDPYGDTSSGGSSGSSSGGKVAECKNSFDINGMRVEAKYKVNFAEAATPGEGETLTMGPTNFDVKQGRVFLLDLTGGSLVYRQKNVALPAVGTKIDSTDALKKVAEETQKNLAKQDAEIDAFLK